VVQEIPREKRRIQKTVKISKQLKSVSTSEQISCKLNIILRERSSHDFETIVTCDEK